jgi:hypothetical protein
LAWLPTNATDRRDVDDRAAAGTLHGRHGGLDAEEHAGRIDLHHPVPLLERLVGEARAGSVAGLYVELGIASRNARDVAQDVDLAVGLLGLCHDLAPSAFVPYILLGEAGSSASRRDLLLDRLALGGVAVGQQN